MTKSIIFDLGGVLVPFDFQHAYRKIANYCPYPISEIPQRMAATGLFARYETGKISSRDFIRELSNQLSLKIDDSTFRRVWCSIFAPRTLIEDALLESLHARCRLVLLSNTNEIHFEMVRDNYPILRHFDEFVLSYEIGQMKPAAGIYLEAIRRSACEPGECFYTDDIAVYVEAGRKAGLDAVQFTSASRLKEELSARGVL